MVIAIIGILATIVLVSLNTARSKARDARRVADLRQVALALEMYYDDNKSYAGTVNTNAWAELSALVTGGYIASLPTDPIDDATHKFKYFPDSDNQSYILAADVYENTPVPANLTDCASISNTACSCTDPIYCIGP